MNYKPNLDIQANNTTPIPLPNIPPDSTIVDAWCQASTDIMATEFTPHWVEHPFIRPHGPNSWVFYVVANIYGRRYPLAVVHRDAPVGHTSVLRGDDLIVSCLRIVRIFSDPCNRVAIESEVALAGDFFHDTENVPLPSVELPKDIGYHYYATGYIQAPKPSSDWGITKFPFISTCLLLGASFGTKFSGGCDAKPWPLGTIFRDDNIQYGMVVIDITDMDNPRYGIVGFMIRTMTWVVTDRKGVIDNGPVGTSAEMVEDDRPRKPLSAAEYMVKFGYEDNDDVVSQLKQTPLIDVSAMGRKSDSVLISPLQSLYLLTMLKVIWGQSDNTDLNTTYSIPANQIPRSRHEEATGTSIDHTIDTDSLDVSRAFPNLQNPLQRQLRDRSEYTGHLRSAKQLICRAFGGKRHLDLARFKGLSAEAIGAALETEDLKNVKSISLCIDTVQSPVGQILDALSRSSSPCDLYFCQEPTRINDQAGTELFLALSTRQHLFRGKVAFAAAFSAPLNKSFWLPTINYQQPFEIFPIQHMFIRQQISPSPGSGFMIKRYYLADGLLRPEAFAAGFLSWLRRPGHGLFAFAGGPPTLDNMSRAEISPIPAENFTIPTYLVTGDGKESLQIECWPKIRDLIPGSWTVLVLRELYVDREVAAHNQRAFDYQPVKAQYVKYAFIRHRLRIEVHNLPEHLGPEELEVGGLKEFLKVTAPEVDSTLVDRRLEEATEYLAGIPQQARLGPGLEWLSVLEHDEAYSILSKFLRDAPKVEDNLRVAMKELQQGESSSSSRRESSFDMF